MCYHTYLTYVNLKQDYQMFYLLLTIGFGLGMDRTPLTLHENCLRTLVGCGAMLIAISVCRAGVGL